MNQSVTWRFCCLCRSYMVTVDLNAVNLTHLAFSQMNAIVLAALRAQFIVDL